MRTILHNVDIAPPPQGAHRAPVETGTGKPCGADA
jgi:hypothetical protein